MQWLARNELDRAALLLGSAPTCPSFKPCLWSSRRSTTALGCHSSETDADDGNKVRRSSAADAVLIRDSNNA